MAPAARVDLHRQPGQQNPLFGLPPDEGLKDVTVNPDDEGLTLVTVNPNGVALMAV
jgi:hypothetical protein